MNNFYVYVYLDPRKPGNFVYAVDVCDSTDIDIIKEKLSCKN